MQILIVRTGPSLNISAIYSKLIALINLPGSAAAIVSSDTSPKLRSDSAIAEFIFFASSVNESISGDLSSVKPGIIPENADIFSLTNNVLRTDLLRALEFYIAARTIH